MRRNIVAGNWKMNNTLDEGLRLIKAINVNAKKTDVNGVQIIVATPFIHLSKAVEEAVSPVRIAAQNCASEASGAYTGEVSAKMIRSTGTEYVILGHSERRAYYGETDEILAQKVNLAIANKLHPIFCIGEVLEEREAERHFAVIKSQLEKALFHLSEKDFGRIILAYEPVWAIGTGKTASPEQAQEMHAFIRKTVATHYNEELADTLSILYGGSMKPANAQELIAQPDVDGGLIGGASLDADDFFGIVKAF